MQKTIVLLLLVLVAGVGIGSLRILRSLRAPLAQLALTQIAPPKWDGKSQLNLLAQVNEEWYLAAWGFSGELKLRVLQLPAQKVFMVNGASYTLNELFPLAQAQNPPRGFEFVLREVGQWAGVPLDSYVVNLKTEDIVGETGGVRLIWHWPKIWRMVQEDLATNLSTGQALRILGSLGKLEENKVSVVSLECGEAEECRAELKRVMSKIFAEEKIVQEGLKVRVFNASEEPGLARETARIFGNIGLTVVEAGNLPEPKVQPAEGESAVIEVFGDFGETRSLQRIEQVLGVKARVDKESAPQRGDVVVVLY